MRRLLLVLLSLAGAGVTSPVSADTGSDVSAVIARAEQLRGLRATHPLAVSALSAAGMRRIVVRELARERRSRSDAAWDDALHLLGVLPRGQSLAAVQRRQLAAQVAGVYIPRNGRLYVLAAGGRAPRSVIAHEAVHALQDQHFDLRHGAFAPRPADHDGELAALALVEGDATDVQSRYVASLSGLALVGELARTLGAMPSQVTAGTPPYLERRLLFPYTAGEAFVRALRARGGRRLLDRAFAHPPRTSAAVLDPARFLAGDPPARAVALPGGAFTFTTTFGAEDVAALTGRNELGRAWLGGRLGLSRRGLDVRLATRGAGRVAAALARVLPPAARVAFHGRLVCVRIARASASVQRLSCR